MSETTGHTSHWSWRYAYMDTAVYKDQGTNVTNHFGPANQSPGTNSTSGVKLPGWRDIIRNGGNATTAFSGTLYSGQGEWFTAQMTYRQLSAGKPNPVPRFNESYGYLPYPQFPVDNVPTSVVSDVTNRCVRRFLDEFEQAFSSNNLTGRSIKHFQHDIHSVSNPMKGLRKEISSYLGRLGKVVLRKGPKSRILREVRAAYLELTFGIEPFTDDISAILSDLGRYRFPTVPISASASEPASGSSGIRNGGLGLNWPCSETQAYKMTSLYSLRYKGAVRTQTGMDGKIGFIQSQRLLPQDWVPTLFSILPYAWMVDYFTNIGNIIDGLCFCFNDLAWACKTSRITSTVTYSDVVFNTASLASSFLVDSYASYGGNAFFSKTTVSRSPLTPSDLVPRLIFTIPTKPKQWLNMMAVFQPRILKIVSSFL